MNNSQGWVRLHRQFLEWEWYEDNNTKVLFLHILLKANHKDRRYKGKLVKRGELLTGRDILSKEVGLSVQQIRTALNKLKSTNEITIKSTKQGTIIQIVKYNYFQIVTNESTNNQPTSNQQVTTNNNVKKEKNEKNIPTFLDFKSYALSKQPDVSLEALKYKYDAWVENGWRNGNDREIKNWKTSLLQTLQYIPKQPKKVRDLDQEFYENVMKQVNANK